MKTLNTKQQKKSAFLTNSIILIFILSVVFYINNKEPNENMYNIRTSGEHGFSISYNNLTGQDAIDKKIVLSDDYWTGGKFKF